MLFSITNNYVRHACRCVCAAEKLSLELYLLSPNISYFIVRLLSSVLVAVSLLLVAPFL